jgi:hypothetical protein
MKLSRRATRDCIAIPTFPKENRCDRKRQTRLKTREWRGSIYESVRKALTYTLAILWGLCFLLVGLANLIWPPYGGTFLELMSSNL